ncbi:MAG: hypothetical protein LOX97_05205, partial [Sphingomonas sp.]|nr:hypothetical protein [Sphingomonas sp.]
AERVREIRPETGILLITGYTGARDEELQLPRLSKPFGQAGVAAALARFAGQPGNVIKFPAGKLPTTGQ